MEKQNWADREELRELAEAFRCAPRQHKSGERSPMYIALDALAEFIASSLLNAQWAITADEMAAFDRFCECAEDFDSGGHDVPKEMMKRLAIIGLVRPCGFGRHETTLFGDGIRARVVMRQGDAAQCTPIDMILHCPSCNLQHIDAPDDRTRDWQNEPHRSHLCHGCGHIWRPADVATNGVAAINTKGKADSAIPSPAN